VACCQPQPLQQLLLPAPPLLQVREALLLLLPHHLLGQQGVQRAVQPLPVLLLLLPQVQQGHCLLLRVLQVGHRHCLLLLLHHPARAPA
jgi:hypothetical protein